MTVDQLIGGKKVRHNVYYVLDENGDPKPAESREWVEWMESSGTTRQVAEDIVNGRRVSTVFLGLDHNFGLGRPLLYETMIFPGGAERCILEEYMDRYSTKEEALAGHKRAIEYASKQPESKRV